MATIKSWRSAVSIVTRGFKSALIKVVYYIKIHWGSASIEWKMISSHDDEKVRTSHCRMALYAQVAVRSGTLFDELGKRTNMICAI